MANASKLPKIKQLIVDTIARRPGISGSELTDAVYADDPNGGPDSINCVRVHIAQLNKRLLAFKIVGHVTDGYRIEHRDGQRI